MNKLITATLLLVFLHLEAFTEVYVDYEGSRIEVDPSDGRHYLNIIRYAAIDPERRVDPIWIAAEYPETIPDDQLHVHVANHRDLERLNPLRQLIVNRYFSANDQEAYIFPSREDFSRAALMRLEAIRKMKEMNARNHYWYGKPYSTTSTLWEPTSQNPLSNQFRQKAGTPYDAIRELCHTRTKTVGECLGAVKACIWFGAAVAMGDSQFNAKHSARLDMDKRETYLSHCEESFDKRVSAHVPGDWLYMKNHNYRDVIRQKDFERFGWIDRSNYSYPWSGENCFFVGLDATGRELYEGLGLGPVTEDAMREKLRNNYNNDFDRVVHNGGELDDGSYVPVIDPGPDADALIRFLPAAHLRIYP